MNPHKSLVPRNQKLNSYIKPIPKINKIDKAKYTHKLCMRRETRERESDEIRLKQKLGRERETTPPNHLLPRMFNTRPAKANKGKARTPALPLTLSAWPLL